MANTIKVEILGDVKNIRQSLQNVEGQLGGFGKKMSGVGKLMKGAFVAAGAAVAGSKVKDFFSDSIQAASDLEQSTGAVEAVFGKQADGIKKVAGEAANSFGLSKNSYQELATVLGAGLKNQGIKDFGGETQKVIGLGADLAAQFGGDTKSAVEAIGSLMRGEADPIEQYGVSIKESAISAELAATGQNKLKGAALEQAKAQARLKLLFDQTKDAQGAFGREGDTLATKQQKNAAAWENLKAKLGNVFLPVMVKVQDFLSTKVLPIVEKLFTWIAEKAPPAVAAVKGFLAGLKGDGSAGAYLEYVKTAFAAILPIIQGLIAALVAAWPSIKAALLSVMAALKGVFDLVIKLWDLFGPQVVATLTNVFTTLAGVVAGVFQVIGGIVKTFTALLSGDWKGAWEGITGIVQGQLAIAKAIILGVLTAIDNATGGALTRVKNIWLSIFTWVKTFVTTTFNSIKTSVASGIDSARAKITAVLGSIKTTWSGAWNWLKSKLSEAWTAIVSTVTSKINSVKQKISDLKSKITGVFSNASSWLRDAGRKIIDGLLDGINSKIDSVRSRLRTLTNLIPDWKGPKERDAKLLYDAGRLIMQSLVNGFDAGESAVERKLGQVTTLIGKGLDDVMTPTLNPSLSLAGADASLRAYTGAQAAGVGNVYQITVEAPVGADGASIGRELVGYIRQYESLGGRK